MGTAVAAQARGRGVEVLWCPEGRSNASRDRAERAGFSAVSGIGEMAERAEIILSLCPPANAEEVAGSVAAHSFSGIYVDANAVSPASMAMISAVMMRADAEVVDGSVIGSPPSAAKTTRLYLSGPGPSVVKVAELFGETAVDARPLPGGIGRASALKLSYSTFQKTSRVLAAVSYALARDYGVENELLDVAKGRTASYLAEIEYIPKVASRSWRWAPEMREAVSALSETCLPTELAEAAATVMDRWADSKDLPLEISEALGWLHKIPED
ncbi:DUF1932 domain-containing protein [Streptomyces albireticuli]|nr:DUF1932 domain-containing protein [Streptomyces albireticuli]